MIAVGAMGGRHEWQPRYTLRFHAPNVPLSINESTGMHWKTRVNRLDPWRDEAYWAWKEARTTSIAIVTGQRCAVQVDLPFKSHKRRDPHNYTGTVVKKIIDGLVIAGCWPDDTAEFVVVSDPILTVYKQSPDLPMPVRVHLTPIGSDQ